VFAPTHCVLGRLDPVELAWAAGFFDGEGSTIVQADARRPGYRRLVVSVPQSSRDGVPYALVRLQRAMLGLGSIEGPDETRMYVWRAFGLHEAQAVLALIWTELGAVKRLQAARALNAVSDQYRYRMYAARPPKSGRLVAHSNHATFATPTI